MGYTLVLHYAQMLLTALKANTKALRGFDRQVFVLSLGCGLSPRMRRQSEQSSGNQSNKFAANR
jgi:hypothetical protein